MPDRRTTGWRQIARALAVIALLAAVLTLAWRSLSPSTEVAGGQHGSTTSPTTAQVVKPTVAPAALPTPPSTSTPVPTPTPPPLWAELDATLARGPSGYADALVLYRNEPAAVEARGRDSFVGLEAAIADAHVDRVRSFDRSVLDGDYDAAQATIDELLLWFPDSDDIVRRATALQVWKEQSIDSEPWVGEVPHLFIHSLIVRPELAFDGDYQDRGYRTYMITRTEFERMLAELHANDFVLMDIHTSLGEDSDGSIELQAPQVPIGKKPFVLSIDDVSYYEYMEGNGFAERVEVDEVGNIVTVMVDDDGRESRTRTGDAMPILDDFVLDHPDFSIGGTKGIIAVTGYEGILGYDFSRDQTDHPEFETRRAAATEIATRLRELGWQFASHSYTHGDWLKNPHSSYGRFIFDSDNWAAEIEPVVGDTDLYISPFGYYLGPNNPRYRYLVDELGFRVFAPISDGVTTDVRENSVVMHRLAVDGFMLTDGAVRLEPYFDASAVLDEARN